MKKVRMAAKKDKPVTDAPGFEATVANLESIVATLENEESSLEKSLEAFERGIKIIREAQRALATAEQKVKLLLEQNEEPVSSEFSELQDTE
jgi:exodeoxyribonuclease VII small subunit